MDFCDTDEEVINRDLKVQIGVGWGGGGGRDWGCFYKHGTLDFTIYHFSNVRNHLPISS